MSIVNASRRMYAQSLMSILVEISGRPKISPAPESEKCEHSALSSGIKKIFGLRAKKEATYSSGGKKKIKFVFIRRSRSSLGKNTSFPALFCLPTLCFLDKTAFMIRDFCLGLTLYLHIQIESKIEPKIEPKIILHIRSCDSYTDVMPIFAENVYLLKSLMIES